MKDVPTLQPQKVIVWKTNFFFFYNIHFIFSDDDDDATISQINVLSNSSRFYRRFNYEGREIRVQISAPPTGVNPWSYRLHRNNNESEFFRQGPEGLSFRSIDSFNEEDLWDVIYRVVQSNTDFSINETLIVSVALVRPPVGRGKSSNKLIHENVRKQSILQIHNADGLCFPRSLVAAIAHCLRGQDRSGGYHDYWKIIRDSTGLEQRERAEELVRDANVVIPPNGCGLPEIRQFQAHLARDQVAIVVYNFQSFGRGGRPLFDGTNYVQNAFGDVKFTLRILFYENLRHYRPILNLIAASGCRGYCIPCNEGYNDYQAHRCRYRCPKCMQQPRCDETNDRTSCRDCSREFYSPRCLNNHLTPQSYNRNNSVCQKVRMCKRCFMTFSVGDGKKQGQHVCGLSYCNICKKKRPFDHFCYMPPVTERPKRNDGTEFLFVFFDLETMQSRNFETDNTAKIHEVNLCIAQLVCHFYQDQIDMEENC